METKTEEAPQETPEVKEEAVVETKTEEAPVNLGNEVKNPAKDSEVTGTSEATVTQKGETTEEEAKKVYEGLGITDEYWEDFKDYQESNGTDFIGEANKVEDARLLAIEFLEVI